MTTNYHTPISTGAAANAGTINTPLGALDAAVTDIDDRVDNIIAGSETSSTETVDARRTYAVLRDRLDQVYPRTNVLLVDANFTTNAGDKRYATISAALSAATAGDTIIIAPGIYTENCVVADSYLKIIGAGKPYFDSGTGRLVGGTVIRGYLDCASYPGVSVRDLGIDLYGVDSTDGITASNTISTPLYQSFENLFVLGNGYGATAHGILASGGGHLTISGITLRNWYHGIAVRSSYVNVTNVDAYACTANTIIIKSETPSGDVVEVNVANVIIDGNPVDPYQRGGPIRVQSANDGNITYFVNIANVTAQNTGEACVIIERAYESGAYRGSISHVNVSNVIAFYGGDDAGRADFDVASGYNITFVNCHSSTRAAGYGFRVRTTDSETGNVKVHSSTSDAGGAGLYSGTNFEHLELNGQQYITTAVGAGLVNAADALPFQQAVQFTGQVLSVVGSAVEICRLVWTGAAGGYSGVVLDVIVACNSGGHVSIDRYRVACERPGSSTLAASAAQDGTALQSAAGAHGSVTIGVNVGTANTLIVNCTGVTAVAAVSFVATALTMFDDAGKWTFASQA